MSSILLLVSLLFCTPSLAISENDFESKYRSEVEPAVSSRLNVSEFRAKDGATIAYGTIAGGTKGTIVIVPGRTEWMGTFTEALYDFSERGYSVAILDHRGQGHSSRLVQGFDVGHVERFSHYVDDFTDFLDVAVLGKLPEPYFLFGDSMGGAISTFYLADHPKVFRAAALVAPMFKINTAPLSESIAFALASVLKRWGFASSYAPMSRAHDFADNFKSNNFTHSGPRYAENQERTRAFPETAVGGPSVNWVYESLLATQKIPALAAKIQTPLLIFQAGNDQFVKNDAQAAFCKSVRYCKLKMVQGAFHSIHIEEDPARDTVLLESLRHFKQ